MKRYFETNRANWDERAAIHMRDTTGMYDFDRLKRGEGLLGPIESSELGDITGKRLLHLQCHIGTDTISLAFRGAAMTGLDFSPKALGSARRLANEVGVDITYLEGNVVDAPMVAGGDFDGVFTTWGTIGWLPDLDAWARAVAGCLRPGGFLYMADGHPTLFMVEEIDGKPELMFNWRHGPDDPIIEASDETYAGDGSKIENSQVFEWNHPISRILGSLDNAGMTVEFFREHEQIPWRAFPSMVATDERMFRQAEGQIKLPLAFSLRAVKR